MTAQSPDRTHPFPYAAAASGEFAGTFVLVFGLVGAAVLSAPESNGVAAQSGIGLFGIALALGLAVMIGAYAFGRVSGAHFNPAVSLAAAIAGRIPWRQLPVYVVAQVLGGLAGSSVIVGLVSAGHSGPGALATGYASNGYDRLSPGHYGLLPVALVEVVGTAVLVFVVLATTHPTAGTSAAPAIIGASLTSILLVALPVDSASLNPARSLSTALYAGPDWLGQVWAFVVFPLVGASAASFVYRAVFAPRASLEPAE